MLHSVPWKAVFLHLPSGVCACGPCVDTVARGTTDSESSLWLVMSLLKLNVLKKKKKQATGTLSHREKSVRSHGLFIQVKCCRKIVRRGFVIPVRGRRSHEMLRWNCNASTVPSLCWKHDFINKDIQLDLEKHERAWLGIKKWYTRLIINKILCLNGQLCVIC